MKNKHTRSIFALLVGATLVLPAYAANFEAWSIHPADDGTGVGTAGTMNDSGSSLILACGTGTNGGRCVWTIYMGTSCDRGHKQSLFVNSDAGAVHLTVACTGQIPEGLYSYVFPDLDEVDRIIRQGTRIGFALPLKSDNFRVIRFDLQGATNAIEQMRAAARRPSNPPPSSGTKDQYM